MSKDLYFFPILFEALKKSDLKESLIEAFRRIQELGQKPEHQEGFRQFQVFVQQIVYYAEKKDVSILDNVLMIELMDRYPELIEDYEELFRELLPPHQSPAYPSLIVEKDGNEIQNIQLSPGKHTETVKKVGAGSYRICLSDGRVLTRFELESSDVSWADANPEEDYPLAADTEDISELITFKTVVFEETIEITVTQGLKQGTMKLQINL